LNICADLNTCASISPPSQSHKTSGYEKTTSNLGSTRRTTKQNLKYGILKKLILVFSQTDVGHNIKKPKKMNILKRAEQGQSFLVADDGQFLGKLTLNEYETESILNNYGSHGSKYASTSINNQYSSYGSKYSSLSPNNQFTSTPPTIYLRGIKYGYLTKNKFKSGTTLDPDNLTNWMRSNNLNY
jgi:hypothetical protein